MKTHTHGSQTDVIDGFSEEEEEGERSKDKGSCWVEAVGGHREREACCRFGQSSRFSQSSIPFWMHLPTRPIPI